LLIEGILCNLLPGDISRGHHHHHHHGDHSQSLSDQSDQHKEARKGRSSDLMINFSEAVDDAETGLKCVIEKENLKTLEKASLLTCTHSMVNVCHYSYVTQFRPNREEQCAEYYDKTCTIVFNKQAKMKPSGTATAPWSDNAVKGHHKLIQLVTTPSVKRS
jgi:hypothetical protein